MIAKEYTAYLLLLEEDKYYIGSTMDLSRRITEHVRGKGSLWTKRWKVLDLLKTIDLKCSVSEILYIEDHLTEKAVSRLGYTRVRGGSFWKPKFDPIGFERMKTKAFIYRRCMDMVQKKA